MIIDGEQLILTPHIYTRTHDRRPDEMFLQHLYNMRIYRIYSFSEYPWPLIRPDEEKLFGFSFVNTNIWKFT